MLFGCHTARDNNNILLYNQDSIGPMLLRRHSRVAQPEVWLCPCLRRADSWRKVVGFLIR